VLSVSSTFLAALTIEVTKSYLQQISVCKLIYDVYLIHFRRISNQLSYFLGHQAGRDRAAPAAIVTPRDLCQLY
jgi:hypothetical protein